MNDNVQLINPTLATNIPLVTALMNSVHGTNPGRLRHYKVYTLNDTDGKPLYYSLTLSVLQFISDPMISEKIPELRMDIIESTVEEEGQFGRVVPVIKSIIFQDGGYVFDESGSYVVKGISVTQDGITDKPGKPDWYVRLTNREQYLGSQIPHLGMHYGLIKEKDITFLHMKRAPGRPLQDYIGTLNGVEFLTLACTLLEEIPKQIHREVSTGKHMGERIVHCDLKESNIMAELKNNVWTLSAVDMGLAKTMKKGKYATLHRRGNLMVWDSTMLYAALGDRHITYNAETDLYALFVIIATLAGAPGRGNLNDRHELFVDLAQPDLDGAFSHMGFDPATREKLKFLLRQMLCDNRKKRASAQEALAVFQEMLAKVERTQPEIQPEKKHKVTAKELMDWVKIKLVKKIRSEKARGIEESHTLREWISHYRELYSLADTKEKQKFSNLLKKETKSISLYIFNLLRFRLLDEYDDNASTRLLLRHHQLTSPFRHVYKLPEQWEHRFNTLGEQIPIQVNERQALMCKEIGRFKRNVSTVLNHEITEEQFARFVQLLTEELEYQMSIKFADWAKQLPAIIRPFNQLFECTINLTELSRKLKEIHHLNNGFERQFEEWSDILLDQSISGGLPENLKKFFKIYHFLADILHVYDEHGQKYTPLFKDFPILRHSVIGYDAINTCIKNLNIIDYHSVLELSQKIKLLFKLVDLHSCLYKSGTDTFYILYKPYIKECRGEFTEHINNYLIKQVHTSITLNDQLNIMLAHLGELDEINNFIKYKVCHHHYIVTTLNILLKDKPKIVQIGEMIRQYDYKEDLYTDLNEGLKELLPPRYDSRSNTDEALDEKLFAEVTRFFACPIRYKPQSILRIHAKGNPHSIFATAQPTKTENGLHLSLGM